MGISGVSTQYACTLYNFFYRTFVKQIWIANRGDMHNFAQNSGTTPNIGDFGL